MLTAVYKYIECVGTHGFASDVWFVWLVRFYGGIGGGMKGKRAGSTSLDPSLNKGRVFLIHIAEMRSISLGKK